MTYEHILVDVEDGVAIVTVTSTWTIPTAAVPVGLTLAKNDLGNLFGLASAIGGAALTALRDQLDARRVVPLFGSVDPDVHHPAPTRDAYVADLSYLGTYAEDRQQANSACDQYLNEPLEKRSFHNAENQHL